MSWWNSAVQLLTLTHNPSCCKFLSPSNSDGSRVKQVAFNGVKEKGGKENTESKGRNGEASATVHRPTSHWLYWWVIPKAQASPTPLSSSAKQGSPHILWPQGIFVKLRSLQKALQSRMPNYYLIINVPTSDWGKWNPKLIWYHMLWVAFSNSLQKLAFIIFVGSSFSVYRNMCTHQNRPS